MSRRRHELHDKLEALYGAYTHRRFISPDPLEVVYRYSCPADRETAGLIAASLAFGNVKTILASAERALAPLPSPARDLLNVASNDLAERLHGFRHRFAGEETLLDLLRGIRQVILRHGSLGAAFEACLRPNDDTVVPALTRWVSLLREGSPLPKNPLLSEPARGSACKRLHMYLRWMIRRDAVDPGVWSNISPRLLVYPVDTHLHYVARGLRLTRRNSADLRTALEITLAMRGLAPEDPVRYDFCLTRLGIRREYSVDGFLAWRAGNELRKAGQMPWEDGAGERT